jgi:YD repeat-containing protein
LTQVIDGRGTETRYEYDGQGRETTKKAAYGTSIEARTDTFYDLAGNVTEVRHPRYFDSSDTEGYQKAKETWTCNGQGLVASHTDVKNQHVYITFDTRSPAIFDYSPRFPSFG